MDPRSLVIWTGGYWESGQYVGGKEEYIICPPNFNHADLVREVQRIAKCDGNNSELEIISLIRTKRGKRVRFNVKGDMELNHVLSIIEEDEPTVYVSTGGEQNPIPLGMSHSPYPTQTYIQTPPLNVATPNPFSYPAFNIQHPYPLQSLHGFSHQNLVHLMTSQIPYGPGMESNNPPLNQSTSGYLERRVEKMREHEKNEGIGLGLGSSIDLSDLEESFPRDDWGAHGLDGGIGFSGDDQYSDDYNEDEDEDYNVESDDEDGSSDHCDDEDIIEDEELDGDESHDYAGDAARTAVDTLLEPIPLDVNMDDDTGDDLRLGSSSSRSRRSWNFPGFSDYSINELQTDESSSAENELYNGATFLKKDNLIRCLGMYALKEKFECRIKRSSQSRYIACCKIDGCTFELRASAIGGSGLWKVKKLVKEHSCQSNIARIGARQVNSKLLSQLIAPRLLDTGRVMRPRDIQGDMRREHGLDIAYSKAWRARENAQRNMFGDAETSFQLLPSYLYMIEKENPGSVVNFQTDDDNRFEFMFMALGPCIHGFRNYARKVVVVDGTFLKGKMKGTLFVAATKDGNEQIFPIAFGVGDSENDRSWTWFMSELRLVIGTPSPPDLIFISDRHRSIRNAIKTVFPTAAHGVCTYHLKQNLRSYKNEKLLETYDKMCRVYRKADFLKLLPDLKDANQKAYETLCLKIGVKRWARAYSPVRRYNFMTSNVAESFNSSIRFARKFPIVTMLEFIRGLLQRWWHGRRELASNSTHELTEYANNKVSKSIEASQYMTVEAVGSGVYNVNDGEHERVVNLNHRSCTCRRFELDLLPCAHAVAAIRVAKHPITAYCGQCFQMDNLRDMYAGCINPVCHPEDWSVPTEIKARVVLPPVTRVPSGRPRSRRIPSAGERRRPPRQEQLCSRCKQPGHNRTNCVNSIGVEIGNSCEGQHSTVRARNSGRRCCSLCGQPGHTRQSCRVIIDNNVTSEDQFSNDW